MVEASDRPFDENLHLTGEVVAMAHSCGVPVEGELGYVPLPAIDAPFASKRVQRLPHYRRREPLQPPNAGSADPHLYTRQQAVGELFEVRANRAARIAGAE